MGSTSIVGMPGKPIIDIAILIKDLFPYIPQYFITEMKNLGYTYWGPAVAAGSKQSDHWFFQDQFVLHLINSQNTEALDDLQNYIDYRDYCNSERSAFDRYKTAKVGASKS